MVVFTNIWNVDTLKADCLFKYYVCNRKSFKKILLFIVCHGLQIFLFFYHLDNYSSTARQMLFDSFSAFGHKYSYLLIISHGKGFTSFNFKNRGVERLCGSVNKVVHLNVLQMLKWSTSVFSQLHFSNMNFHFKKTHKISTVSPWIY